MSKPNLEDVLIRTELKPGDLGFVTFLHGKMYAEEYNFGMEFEAYVAEGLVEFYRQYNPDRDRVWVCVYESNVVGFMLLMDRGKAAQLRYFIIVPPFRGIGLGKKLMDLYMDFLRKRKYESSYLWTAHELHTAAALYVRHGFKLTEKKESVAFGKPLTEHKYELKL